MELNIITSQKDVVATEKYLDRTDPKRIFVRKLLTVYSHIAFVVIMSIAVLFLSSQGEIETRFIIFLSLGTLIAVCGSFFVLPKMLDKNLESEQFEINRSYKKYLQGARIIEIDKEKIQTSTSDKIYELPWDSVDFTAENENYFFVFPKEKQGDRVVIPKSQLEKQALPDVRTLLHTYAKFTQPKKA